MDLYCKGVRDWAYEGDVPLDTCGQARYWLSLAAYIMTTCSLIYVAIRFVQLNPPTLERQDAVYTLTAGHSISPLLPHANHLDESVHLRTYNDCHFSFSWSVIRITHSCSHVESYTPTSSQHSVWRHFS